MGEKLAERFGIIREDEKIAIQVNPELYMASWTVI